MTQQRAHSNLVIAPRCLAVFVDDTGHEELAKGHPVYGLGGCAALGRDIERLIHRPWKELRRRIAGSPDAPLHASELPRIAKPGDFEAVAQFFRAQNFWRFGAVFTEKTTLPTELVKWPRAAGPFLAAVKLEDRLLVVLYQAAKGSVCC